MPPIPLILTNENGDITCIQVETWNDAKTVAKNWSGFADVDLILDGERVSDSTRAPADNDVVLVKQGTFTRERERERERETVFRESLY
jgi:hypothetical protein